MKKNSTRTNKTRFHICGAVLFLCLAVISSCTKKEDSLGLGIFPTESQLGLLTTDTFTINAKTVRVDSVPSDELAFTLLGSYVDPLFGRSNASFTTQFQPSTSSVDFGDINTLVVDSVCLSLVYTGYYGIQGTHQFTVKELTENIYKDSTYYSNRTFSTLPTDLLSQSNYTPNYEGKIIPTGNEPEQLRLKINTAFGKRLIDQVNTSTDVDAFLSLFKGITVSSDTSFSSAQMVNEGAIWHFDVLNSFSKITVYYTNGTNTASYDFVFTKDIARVNHFSHNYTGTMAETALNDSTFGEQKLLTQGMAGLAVDFKIPYLKNITDNGPVSINKAEIILTVEANSDATYQSEYLYELKAFTESGGLTYTLDQSGKIGGDLINNEYRFIINRDIQYLTTRFTKGNNKNFGYEFTTFGSGIESARTILNGTKTGEGQMKLIVSYTPI